MDQSNSLHLYEELMLLAVRNSEGTFAAGYVEHAAAGALMAELLLENRIAIDTSAKHVVHLANSGSTDDPILDALLTEISQSKKSLPLQSWVSRVASWRGLREKIALQLCNRGILRADESKVLLVFTRKTYPEVNPVPEQHILQRLRDAIFSDSSNIEPRTIVLLSLANSVGLLGENLGSREIKNRKKRIDQLIQGEVTGNATREVIAACEAAAAIAAFVPIMMDMTFHSHQ